MEFKFIRKFFTKKKQIYNYKRKIKKIVVEIMFVLGMSFSLSLQYPHRQFHCPRVASAFLLTLVSHPVDDEMTRML